MEARRTAAEISFECDLKACFFDIYKGENHMTY